MVKQIQLLSKTGSGNGDYGDGNHQNTGRKKGTIFVVFLLAIVCLFSVRQQTRYDDFYLHEIGSGSSGSNSSSIVLESTQEFEQQDSCFLGGNVNTASASASGDGANATTFTVTSFCRSCLLHHESSEASHSSPIMTIWNRVESHLHEAALESLPDCYGWEGGPLENETAKNYSQGGLHQLTQNMFAALTSYRLKKSIKVPPHPFVMERVLQVIWRRITDPHNHPPLRIAVFGGSVTEGCHSGRNTIGLPNMDGHCKKNCAWSTKLERILNKVLGSIFGHYSNTSAVVEVNNFAVAGSDSDIGSTLFEYDLWHDMNLKEQVSGKDFDIFISAFSANDAQAPSEQKEFLYESMQNFVLLAAEQRPCSDLPLVIQLEDVMIDGTFSRDNVKQGLWYSRHMAETASWASVMAVSYPDAIRDFVYANPTDTTLFEYGQLHPGLSFHTGIAWILTYNLLSGFVDACDAPSLPHYHSRLEPRAGFPPPIVTHTLASSDVTALLNQSAREKAQLCATAGEIKTTCVYKWLAAKQGARDKIMVHQAVSSVATNIDGWEAIGNVIRKPRRTWQANKANATFTIQLNDIDSPINQLLILYLRSYGPIWNDSRLHVVIEGRANGGNDETWTELHQTHLEGTHNSQTSINYSYKAELSSTVEAGGSLRATYMLVGGRSFQINGLAACHHPLST